MPNIFERLILKLDRFGEPFKFNVQNDDDLYKSIPGSILSLILLPLIIPFAVYKFNVMRDYGETNIVEATTYNYFDDSFSLTSKDHNFQVAYAMISYDNFEGLASSDYTEYGEVKAFYRSWGIEDVPRFRELKTRNCTQEEISLGNDRVGTKFYEIDSSQRPDLELYGRQLQCFEDDLEIFGTYNSVKAQSLMIQFIACDSEKRACKSESEIKAFMKRKFIITVENSSRFNQDEYNDSKITKESKLVWHPMNTVFRQESVNQIGMSHVNMQDEYLQFGDSTADNA